jgi:hypothetical protein
LLGVILGACAWPAPSRRIPALAVVGVCALAVLAVGDIAVGRGGPLRSGGLSLAQPIMAELGQTGRSVLVLAAGDQPVRQVAGRLPSFGDDDIAPVVGSPDRLTRWDAVLRSGDPANAKAVVAQAAMAGVLYVVLPDRASAARLSSAAGELVAPVGAASDGRPVLRLLPLSGTATLISSALAREAVGGGVPPVTLGAQGVSPVSAQPPDVGVRVSEGALGRLLVLAAQDEAGWEATIDGQPAPVVPAWGNQVAVSVPMSATDVRVRQPSGPRDALLLIEAAVLLFALLTVVPGRRRPI